MDHISRFIYFDQLWYQILFYQNNLEKDIVLYLRQSSFSMNFLYDGTLLYQITDDRYLCQSLACLPLDPLFCLLALPCTVKNVEGLFPGMQKACFQLYLVRKRSWQKIERWKEENIRLFLSFPFSSRKYVQKQLHFLHHSNFHLTSPLWF